MSQSQHFSVLGSARALNTELHLACVVGPDKGLVIPLVDGTVIGRATVSNLVDQTVSREHFHVRLNGGRRGGTLTTMCGTNPGKTIRTGRHKRIKMGEGTWRVRSRPPVLDWRIPKDRSSPTGWLRWLPLFFLAWILWRFFPSSPKLFFIGAFVLATGIGGGVHAYRARLKRRFDGAYLTLAWLAHTPREGKTDTRSEPLRVWPGPFGKAPLVIGRGTTVGVLGPTARAGARWVAVQIALQSPQFRLGSASEQRGSNDRLPQVILCPPGEQLEYSRLHADSVVIAWASTVEELPPHATLLVHSRAPVGASWLARDIGGTNSKLTLPDEVRLDDLDVSLTSAATLHRWRSFAYRWNVPVGLGAEGSIFEIDLPNMGPHALFAGATGSGKTVALQTLLWSLVLHVPPTALRLVLIDYKGGAGLSPLAKLPHVEIFSSDLDVSTTAWVIRRLKDVLQRRKRQLLDRGYADIRQWEERAAAGGSPPPPRLIIVIDEFQVLYEEHPELLGVFTRLSAQGRSLGLHLVLATQRPGQAVNADLRATVDLRIGLRFTEVADSLATLGHKEAARLPKVPGRALCGDFPLQFALVSNATLPAVIGSPKQNWPTPLPDKLEDSGANEAFQVGVRDSSTSELEPVPIFWDEKPLLFAGPANTAPEVRRYALAAARRIARTERVPLHVVTDADAEVQGAATTLRNSDSRSVAALLEVLPQTGPGVVLFENLPAVLREFDFQGLGQEFLVAWTKLIHLADKSDLRVIAVDGEGSQASRSFKQTLAKVPAPDALADRSLLHHLPTLRRLVSATDLDGELTQEEAVSTVPGRFVATGFTHTLDGHSVRVPLPPSAVQLFEPGLVPHQQGVGTAIVRAWPRPPVNGGPLLLRCGPHFNAGSPVPAGTIIVGLPEEHWEGLEVGDGSALHLPAGQWASVVESGQPWFVLEPPLELLRYLGSSRPQSNLALRAAHPYPPFCGVFLSNGRVETACLTSW